LDGLGHLGREQGADMRTTTPLVLVAVFAMAMYAANLNDELSA